MRKIKDPDMNAKLINEEESKNQAPPDFSRKSTFSRAFTFDTNVFRESISQPFEGLTRTLTEIGNKIDPDAQYTKAIISEYAKHADRDNEGDLPLPAGFARKYKFWKIIVISGMIALFLGVAISGFQNFIDEVNLEYEF